MMYPNRLTHFAFAAIICACVILAAPVTRAASLEEVWENPPDSAKPWVIWYWMHGAISEEGLTADLEAMAQAGIGGALFTPIKPVLDPPLYDPPTPVFSERWWTMVRHTCSEAKRLGLELGMFTCDGFATGGGPFITPELSMQKVTWSRVDLAGGETFDKALPQPETNEGYYNDIAVLAFPSLPGMGVSTHSVQPKVTSNMSDVRNLDKVPNEGGSIRSREEGWFQYEFDEPFTCRSIVIRAGGRNYHANRLIVQYSNDGENFTSLGRLDSPRHGWYDWGVDNTHAIPATTAKFFRFVYDKEGTEDGSEELDSAKWANRLVLTHLELFSEPRIQLFEAKSGAAWRYASRPTDSGVLAMDGIKLEDLVDLTDKVGGDGQLNWTAPAGHDWTILRIGHTSTGTKNETGGALKGLEGDKFNPAATELLFENWMGETRRQVGPELFDSVVKMINSDSWECGSQNWSPVFAREFEKRRGYDPRPYLPAMAGLPVVSMEASERFLHDVRETIGELIVSGFFEPMSRLSHEHGLVFTGQNTGPVMVGDGMRHFGVLDEPAGEFWLRSPTHDKPNDISDAVSAAHVYGKNIVSAEAYTELWIKWDEHPGMLKALGDLNFAKGINKFNIHLTTHNPWKDRKPGMTLDHVGLYFQRDQIWWPMADAWVDYLARTSAMLQQGRPVAQVAYFTGEEIPRRSLLPGKLDPPLPDGYKADSINRDALLRLAEVRDGKIVLLGGAEYDLLVLPGEQRMSVEVARKLNQMLGAGARIYGSRPLGMNPGMANDMELKKEQSFVWSGSNDPAVGSPSISNITGGRLYSGTPLIEVLQGIGSKPSLQILDTKGLPENALAWTHRKVGDADVYFISNQLDMPYTPRLRIGRPTAIYEAWDPVSGDQVEGTVVKKDETGAEVLVQLAPSGSAFLIVRDETPVPKRYYNATEDMVSQQLEGPWEVSFEGIDGVQNWRRLQDWTQSSNEAIKHFSGVATYRMDFNWTGRKGPNIRALLALGGVNNMARVLVNGRDSGVLWTKPYKLDITREIRSGRNTLEIQVANTWANRMIGDLSLPVADRQTTSTSKTDFGRNPELLPAGLVEPVWLLTEH